MQIVITICVIIITLVIIIVAVEFIDTLKRISCAAEEISKLTININERIDDIKPAFKSINTISSGIYSLIDSVISKINSLLKR